VNNLLSNIKLIAKKFLDTLGLRELRISEKNFDPWISTQHLVQPKRMLLSELRDHLSQHDTRNSDDQPKIRHIVNFYETNGVDLVQLRTAQSMQLARDNFNGVVELVNVQHQSDADQTPKSFICAPHLTTDVRALLTPHGTKPFPLIFEVLRSGSLSLAPDEYLIYTNADICIQPNFYSFVQEFIRKGFDCIIINRVTVSQELIKAPVPDPAKTKIGVQHGGYDCFIIRKSTFDRFVENKACIGVGFVMQGLLFNMVAKAKKFVLLTNVSMTYHYGDDQPWKDASYSQLEAHNKAESLKTLKTLSDDEGRADAISNFFRYRESDSDFPDFLNSL
jgi:hypothetical protein